MEVKMKYVIFKKILQIADIIKHKFSKCHSVKNCHFFLMDSLHVCWFSVWGDDGHYCYILPSLTYNNKYEFNEEKCLEEIAISNFIYCDEKFTEEDVVNYLNMMLLDLL